jgi:hypothetical protein
MGYGHRPRNGLFTGVERMSRTAENFNTPFIVAKRLGNSALLPFPAVATVMTQPAALVPPKSPSW